LKRLTTLCTFIERRSLTPWSSSAPSTSETKMSEYALADSMSPAVSDPRSNTTKLNESLSFETRLETTSPYAVRLRWSGTATLSAVGPDPWLGATNLRRAASRLSDRRWSTIGSGASLPGRTSTYTTSVRVNCLRMTASENATSVSPLSPLRLATAMVVVARRMCSARVTPARRFDSTRAKYSIAFGFFRNRRSNAGLSTASRRARRATETVAVRLPPWSSAISPK
jgi:hypothetical protein